MICFDFFCVISFSLLRDSIEPQIDVRSCMAFGMTTWLNLQQKAPAIHDSFGLSKTACHFTAFIHTSPPKPPKCQPENISLCNQNVFIDEAFILASQATMQPYQLLKISKKTLPERLNMPSGRLIPKKRVLRKSIHSN